MSDIVARLIVVVPIFVFMGISGVMASVPFMAAIGFSVAILFFMWFLVELFDKETTK